jgi:UDP-N-acetyl-D-mannosaminuronic acid transferase (WecB/TagA/CpsF family)
MIGYQDNTVGAQFDLLAGEDHAMPRLQVVIQAPERAEDVLVVPMGSPRKESGFVERQICDNRLASNRLEFHSLV